MGGNESREVEGCDGVIESDQEIYRDLLEVDGCESLPSEEKRPKELGNADAGDEAGSLSHAPDIGQAIATALEDNLEEDTPSPEIDGNDVRDGLKKVSQIAGNDEPKDATAVTKAERKTKYDGEPSAYLARMRNSIRAQMELHQNFWKLPMSEEGRPITEPPIFNYDRFVREAVPSDKKLMAMLPGDVVLRTKYRDTQTEKELLGMFEEWTFPKFAQPIDDRDSINHMAQYLFYQGLRAEIMVDHKAVSKEHEEILESFSPLARWEAANLDNDEDPLRSLRRRLSLGADPFTGYFGGDQAREKYDYLLDELPHRPSHDLTTWTLYTGAFLQSLIQDQIQQDGPLSPDHHYLVLTFPFFTHYHYGGEAALEERRKFNEDAPGHKLGRTNIWDDLWLNPNETSLLALFKKPAKERLGRKGNNRIRTVTQQFLQYLDNMISEEHPHAEL